ncbi:hypothetical protein [Methanovulcanius yangii]|nr:hypothetical protein [Methanovulcanius yangii]
MKGKISEETIVLDKEHHTSWRKGGMYLEELMGKDDDGIGGHDST